MTVTEGLSGEDGMGIMMIEGRVLKPKDKIYDLVDVLGVGDFSATPAHGFPGKGSVREKIYDLVDVVEKKPRMALVDAGLRDEIMKRASEIAEKISREVVPSVVEKISRELIPAVAERVIREEIEKLKRDA
ncbi:MAG: hypothetical protein ACD_87C00094G0001 [uncultured bacterium]|nr:MAG: hypothetical protein ACD_87C00094G0001 [uncultured bacterium]OHE23159.1 MAG: hypothetical protein A2X92_00665 [Syntrophus sp. GWC2_56_31]HBB16720.1 hypothetical protein [Syntrophus sp. (in: bacteria)]